MPKITEEDKGEVNLVKLNHYPEFRKDEIMFQVMKFIDEDEFPQGFSEYKKRNWRKKFGPDSGFTCEDSNVILYKGVEVSLPSERIMNISSIFNDEKKGLGVGLLAFFKQVSDSYLNIPKKDTDAFLRKQGDYKVAVEPHRIPMRIVAKYPQSRWSVDLVDMRRYPRSENRQYKYIMTCIDYFSGKVWARPLRSRNNGLTIEEQQENDEYREPVVDRVEENEILQQEDENLEEEEEKEAELQNEFRPLIAEQDNFIQEAQTQRPRRGPKPRKDENIHFAEYRVKDKNEKRYNPYGTQDRSNKKKPDSDKKKKTGGAGFEQHGRARTRNTPKQKTKWMVKERKKLDDEDFQGQYEVELERRWQQRIEKAKNQSGAKRRKYAVQQEDNNRIARTPNDLANAFQSILDESKSIPKLMQVDNEFIKGGFADLCKEKGIQIIATLSYQSFSNGRIERCNREVRRKIRAGFVRHNNLEWERYLPTYLENINSQKASRTGKSPNQLWTPGWNPKRTDVAEKTANLQEIHMNSIVKNAGEINDRAKTHKFEKNDLVRINLTAILPPMRERQASGFGKNLTAVHYTPEIYRVSRVFRRTPNSIRQDEYIVEDLEGHPIKRRDSGKGGSRFRGSDLIFVPESNTKTHIENVLKDRQKEKPEYYRAMYINRFKKDQYR